MNSCYGQFVELGAQGWYRDPWAIHEDRYFSRGMPTKLVRDGGRESYEPPPDRPPPEGDLAPAGRAGDEAAGGPDIRRADDQLYDAAKVRRAVFDYFDRTGGQP
jgi:hypothetical protein